MTSIIIFLNLFQLQKKDVRPLNLSQAPPTVSTVKRLLLILPLKTTNLLAKTPNKKFPKERENSKRKIPLGKCYHAFLPRRLKQTELRLDNYLISRQISNLISQSGICSNMISILCLIIKRIYLTSWQILDFMNICDHIGFNNCDPWKILVSEFCKIELVGRIDGSIIVTVILNNIK